MKLWIKNSLVRVRKGRGPGNGACRDMSRIASWNGLFYLMAA